MNKGVLYFWSGQALFIGQSTDATAHRHYSLQIGIGLNEPFRLHFDDSWNTCRVAVVGPNQLHQLDGSGDWQAVLLLDPETESTQRLVNEYLQDRSIKTIDVTIPEKLLNQLRALVSAKRSCRDAKELCDSVTSALTNTTLPQKKIHPKILQVIDYLNQLPLKKVSIKEISQNVYLSESRIIHLFKEQTGIPIRRYLLWLRLIEAIKEIFKGVSFTTAAHEVGFADSAHLSRTFKQMFGITLKDLFKNSQFVQAISCLQFYNQER